MLEISPRGDLDKCKTSQLFIRSTVTGSRFQIVGWKLVKGSG